MSKNIDPCCGTAGFLIAAMHNMTNKVSNEREKQNIRKNQLFGIEIQTYMFTIATTNMIIRGDGKSNLESMDFLAQNSSKIQSEWHCNVGMMNPPYSQGSKQNNHLYEIAFVEHLLDSLVRGGRCAVIIPQSAVTGKTKEEQNIKSNILKHHTLEGVITLNKNTFYGVGTNPCIAIFTSGEPHYPEKECKFINFEDDGYIVAKHVGLIETASGQWMISWVNIRLFHSTPPLRMSCIWLVTLRAGGGELKKSLTRAKQKMHPSLVSPSIRVIL